jgi:hypothetical protein
LSEEKYEQIEAEWKEQKHFRDELKKKPSKLKLYEEKLKAATLQYNRAEGFSSKGKHTTAKKFYEKSESLCEDALEIRQELLCRDASLQIWFDRDISLEVGGDLGLTPVAMPRVITSHSLDKQSNDMRVMSKREVKISTVEMAIIRMRNAESKGTNEKDKKKLVGFFNSSFAEKD